MRQHALSSLVFTLRSSITIQRMYLALRLFGHLLCNILDDLELTFGVEGPPMT